MIETYINHSDILEELKEKHVRILENLHKHLLLAEKYYRDGDIKESSIEVFNAWMEFIVIKKIIGNIEKLDEESANKIRNLLEQLIEDKVPVKHLVKIVETLINEPDISHLTSKALMLKHYYDYGEDSYIDEYVAKKYIEEILTVIRSETRRDKNPSSITIHDVIGYMEEK